MIVDSEDETFSPAGRKLTSDTLAKIDEILYADIGKLQKMDKVDKVNIFVRPLFSCVWDQPSEYRLTIYRYAIIVSFSKYR